jgi:hypothetical protein
MVACALLSTAARADTLDLSLQSPISVAAGGAGSFDVLLTDASGTGVTIAGFDFELAASNSDVTLTGANTSASPYIFSGNSFADTFVGGDLTIQTSPDLIANDIAISGGTFLTAGDTVDLGQVTFTVSSTAPTETVDIEFGSFTDLSDPSGNPISISGMTGGSIDITGATTTVPEPSPLAMLLSAIPVVLLGLCCRWFIGLRTRDISVS